MKAFADRFFYIERPKLAAEFLTEVEKDDRSGPDINRKDSSLTYSERFDIETKGWIYHPALVVYSFIFSPEWRQTYDESGGASEGKTNAFMQGYNAQFVFLEYKPYTLTLRGSKNLSTFHSSFAERSTGQMQTFGATLHLKYQVFTSLDYLHTENEQSGFFSTNNTRDNVRLRADYKEMGGHTSFDASYINNVQETGSATAEIANINARVRNVYDLPDSRGTKITSSYDFRDLKTDYSKRKSMTWAENLSVMHRKNLSTYYSLRNEKTTSGISEKSLSRNIGFGISHTLYENLTTGFSLNAGKNQSRNRAEDNVGMALDWRYVRKIPWGKINVNIGHSYKISDIRFNSSYAEIIDESIVLTDPQGIILAKEHIDSDSIVVTNSIQVAYIKDIDYRISNIGSYTRITRISTSVSLPAGATVLVDYQYKTNPPYDHSVFNQNYGVNLELCKVLNIYYSFSRIKEDFLRGAMPDDLSKSVAHIAGTDLRWKWSMTKLEYVDRKSTNLALIRWNASETVTMKPTNRIFVSLSGNVGESQIEDRIYAGATKNTETFTGIGASVDIITSYRTRLSLRGSRNTLAGNTANTVDNGLASVFTWYYGIYHGDIVYNFTEEKDNISMEKLRKQYIAFKVNRALF